MANQAMMLTGTAGNVVGNPTGAERPTIGARRSAASRVLHTATDVGRWLFLGIAAPELLIEEERTLAREVNSRADRRH